MTLCCCEVSEQSAGCSTPSTSYFAREDQELALHGRHQFWIGCGIYLLTGQYKMKPSMPAGERAVRQPTTSKKPPTYLLRLCERWEGRTPKEERPILHDDVGRWAQHCTPLFQDHRRGRRLSAGASPCRRIPRGGAVPSQACSIWGASSTRVAAKAFCVATDIMLHHRFSHANAADLRRRGAAF